MPTLALRAATVRRRLRLISLAASTLALAGCATLAVPVYRGPPSDHFDGIHFFNYERTPEEQLDDFARKVNPWRHRGHWSAWETIATDTPPPRVAGGEIRVTFVNHATVLIQMDSLNILTDPVWSDRISPLSWVGPERHRPPGIRFEDLPPIDLVLLSHNHYDHLDLPTLKRLVVAFHPRILTGLGNRAFLKLNGIEGAEEVDWWRTVQLTPGIRITGVPARHWSARSLVDQNRTLWLGFVVEAPSGKIYFAGDTGFTESFALIHARFGGGFRLALLPIAPIRPRAAFAPRHMSAGDAVRAYQVLGVATAVGIHFGTFRQGDDGEEEPVDSLRSAVEAARPCDVRFWALRNGEARFVPPDPAVTNDGTVQAPMACAGRSAPGAH